MRHLLRRPQGCLLRLVSVALLGLLLPACATKTIMRGHIPDPGVVSSLKAGESTRNDVIARLGSPSALSSFQDNLWYYIGEEVEKEGFLDPEITARTILAVSFDDDGLLSAANEYTLDHARKVQFVERITPTEGQEFTLIQQLLGNLGRFSGSN